jgi:hypothetical protein
VYVSFEDSPVPISQLPQLPAIKLHFDSIYVEPTLTEGVVCVFVPLSGYRNKAHRLLLTVTGSYVWVRFNPLRS